MVSSSGDHVSEASNLGNRIRS